MKFESSQAVTVSVLLYGCTTSTLNETPEWKAWLELHKRFCAVSNKSWKQHPIKQQLYWGLHVIKDASKTSKTWSLLESKNELKSEVLQ